MNKIRKICAWCFDLIGLCNAFFLLGIGAAQATHGDWSGFLLTLPFIVVWWLYNRAETICRESQELTKKALQNAKESQRIANEFKGLYERLLEEIKNYAK